MRHRGGEEFAAERAWVAGGDQRASKAPEETFSTRPFTSPTPRILIVEDEALIAWNLQSLIEGFGYEVCGTASTGARAIRVADEEQPDLILMDVRLADKNSGIQAAEQILASRLVPIVFVTAFSDQETAHRIAALGAHWLSKPVVPHMLEATLRGVFNPPSEH